MALRRWKFFPRFGAIRGLRSRFLGPFGSTRYLAVRLSLHRVVGARPALVKRLRRKRRRATARIMRQLRAGSLMSVAAIIAQKQEMPRPSPEHQRLGTFVGNWTFKGEMKAMGSMSGAAVTLWSPASPLAADYCPRRRTPEPYRVAVTLLIGPRSRETTEPALCDLHRAALLARDLALVTSADGKRRRPRERSRIWRSNARGA